MSICHQFANKVVLSNDELIYTLLVQRWCLSINELKHLLVNPWVIWCFIPHLRLKRVVDFRLVIWWINRWDNIFIWRGDGHIASGIQYEFWWITLFRILLISFYFCISYLTTGCTRVCSLVRYRVHVIDWTLSRCSKRKFYLFAWLFNIFFSNSYIKITLHIKLSNPSPWVSGWQ